MDLSCSWPAASTSRSGTSTDRRPITCWVCGASWRWPSSGAGRCSRARAWPGPWCSRRCCCWRSLAGSFWRRPPPCWSCSRWCPDVLDARGRCSPLRSRSRPLPQRSSTSTPAAGSRDRTRRRWARPSAPPWWPPPRPASSGRLPASPQRAWRGRRPACEPGRWRCSARSGWRRWASASRSGRRSRTSCRASTTPSPAWATRLPPTRARRGSPPARATATTTGVSPSARGIAAAARSSRAARFQAVAAVGCVAAWLSHTSVDWLHLLPGVTGMALVAAVVLVRVRDPLPAPTAARPASRSGLVLAVAASVVLAATGLTLSRQWLAERYQRQAEAALAARPADALRLADRSLRLDREAVGAYYVKAAAPARFEEARAARAALEEAARREPGDFVTWALLGDLATRTGDRVQARRDYRRALRLNPRDRALKRHLEQVGG